MTLLHVICGFAPPPPIKNPGYAHDSGSRFSTCFFQLLSATGSNKFLTNVYSISYAKQYIKHSNIMAKYLNIFCNNTSILKAIAESLR